MPSYMNIYMFFFFFFSDMIWYQIPVLVLDILDPGYLVLVCQTRVFAMNRQKPT